MCFDVKIVLVAVSLVSKKLLVKPGFYVCFGVKVALVVARDANFKKIGLFFYQRQFYLVDVIPRCNIVTCR